MKAIFFADGGPGVGLGHLRRCAALADAFARLGWLCEFIPASGDTRSWLSSQHLRRNSDPSCDLFVLDSYKLSSAEVLSRFKPHSGLVLAFDDHQNRHDVADLILNTGVDAEKQAWPKRPGLQYLLGPRFHPLPPEYLPLQPRRLRSHVAQILVTLGGATPATQVADVAELVHAEFPEARIDAVLGPFASDQKCASGIVWHFGLTTLKDLLLSCDLAVLSAGQTLFEAAATGTPAVGLSVADNQEPNLAGMSRAGVLLSAGTLSAGWRERLGAALRKLAAPQVRTDLSSAGRRLIDGRGAERIAAAVQQALAE